MSATMSVRLSPKKLTKVATAIHETLVSDLPQTPRVLLTAAWAAVLHRQQLLQRANLDSRFPLARQRLVREVSDICERLTKGLLAPNSTGIQPFHPPAAIRMIYEDLVALDREFEELTVSLQRTTVAVDTPPIVLEDIPLGRFRIVLNWTDIAAPYPPYCVVALDPHPAAGCEAWVHPHLDGETLCAGDGRAAIARALAEGRVYDFFVIVRQVLNTYNSGGAYMPLEEWHGEQCGDCGDRMPASEIRSCEDCPEKMCGDCRSFCDDCERSLCCDCTMECAVCEENFCSACGESCAGCSQPVCRGCLNDDKCTTCESEENEEEAASAATPLPPATHASVYTVFVEQTVVPA